MESETKGVIYLGDGVAELVVDIYKGRRLATGRRGISRRAASTGWRRRGPRLVADAAGSGVVGEPWCGGADGGPEGVGSRCLRECGGHLMCLPRRG